VRADHEGALRPGDDPTKRDFPYVTHI
jgi:hypothetical protein